MAISLANVQTTDTFQTWLNTTNFLATYMSGSIVTANSTFSSTTGNGAVAGNFGATTLFANSALRGGNNTTSATLTVSSNAVFSGTANVAGAANFADVVNTASLIVTGTANVSGIAGFAGGINAASLSVAGPVTFLSTFVANTMSVSAGGVVVANAQGIATTGNVVITATGDLVLNPGASLFANSSLGTAGHVLHSNGSSIYWGNTVFFANQALFANQSISNTFTVGTGSYFVANGNLGINTSSPSTKLHVVGDEVRLQTDGAFYSIANTASGRFGYLRGLASGLQIVSEPAAANIIYMQTTNNPDISIFANGNVGIGTGTSGPNVKLQVNGAFTANGVIRGEATGGEGGQIELNNPGNATQGAIIDVATADNTRWFSLRNNSTHTIGQLSGTGGSISFVTEGATRAGITSTGLFQFNSGYGSSATAYGCRAWINFDGTAASIGSGRGSGGVTSVTDGGTGAYTINFSFTFPDTFYAFAGSAKINGTTTAAVQLQNGISNKTTTTMAIETVNTAGARTDAESVDIVVFR